MNMIYIDTGAMYRAITLLSIREKKNNIDDIINLIKQTKIEMHEKRIFINSEDITDVIRSQEVTNKVSEIAEIPKVRILMTKLQQQIAQNNGVCGRRDIGTTVLNANTIYLTADVKKRAIRRYRELLKNGQKVTLNQVEKELIQRDFRDKQRTFSPLTIAKDAIIIDSTQKTIAQVVDEMLFWIKRGEIIVL